MKKNRPSKSAFFTPRAFLALLFGSLGVTLGMFGITNGPAPSNTTNPSVATRPDSAPAGPAYMDAMPSFVRQSIEATLQWIASFETPPVSRRSIMRASAANAGGGSPGISAPMLVVGEAVTPTVSARVSDLPSVNPFTISTGQREEGQLSNRTPKLPRDPLERDPVVQTTTAPTVGMPPVGASFEGLNISQACGSCLPPDTNGAVGPNHYVQMVNEEFAIYDKTGALLVGPKAINSLWSSTPNQTCATHNNGDPIVIYDQLADRWLLSQFTVQSGTENYAECIAISQTPDPTGAYWLYQFDESADTFQDYPHIGVWPDGYYMSTNLFPNSALLFSTGAGAWVFERPKMLLGQAARYVFFDETGLATNCAPMVKCAYTPGGQLPTSLEGKYPPPAGAPNYFVEVDDTNTPNTPPATGLHDEMHIWKFHVDWTNPVNSTFGTGSTAPALKPGFPGQYAGNAGQPNFIVPIADFLPSACQIENGSNDCTPQPVTTGQPPQYLDVLGDRLMHRVTYRNFGDHEALLISHTVDAQADQPTGVTRNGPRWYELRTVSTTPTVYQQGTFAPLDTTTNGPLWRWMGSAAIDHSGDIAIGYSASGPNYVPSLHYAGRLASDPLGQLAQGEAVLFVGQGIEANTGIFPFRNRWGDYSALQVDPTDDCTFWYTNEYMVSSPTDILPVDWHTRIGSFRFPQCVPPVPPVPTSVVSRKVHGSVGQKDILLPLLPYSAANPRGVECRTPGNTGTTGFDYKVVFTFPNNITSCGNAGTVGGVVVAGPNANQCTENLNGLPDQQYTTISLLGVSDVVGGNGDVIGPQMGLLVGDVNANGLVNSTDTSQVQAQSGQPVTGDLGTGNYRKDVNANGLINSTDTSAVQARSGHGLPTLP